MKRVTLPAQPRRLSKIMQLSIVLACIVFLPGLGHANLLNSATQSTTAVNVLLNYGDGRLVWYNQTIVPSNWNFFNVTNLVTNGNIGSVFFASFGSHFIYSINNVGCPASNIFCDQAWGLWTLDGICWDEAQVGVDQLLVSQVMTVAWFLTPAASLGLFPPTGASCVSASVIVKPGDSQAVVNVGSQGVIPAAILSTRTFDATKVVPTTVRFGRTGTESSPLHWSLQDVNNDGTLDMVLQFNTQGTRIQSGDNQAVLMGRTMDGVPFRGFAVIQTIGH